MKRQTTARYAGRAWGKTGIPAGVRATVVAVCLTLGGQVSVRSASDFEGVVMYRLTTPEMTGDVVYSIKGNKLRWETVAVQFKKPSSKMDPTAAMTGTYMVYDGDTGTMMTVIPSQRIYMTLNAREMARGRPRSSERKPPKIVRTNQTETIAGYPCRHWLFGENPTVDMCLATGLGYFGMSGFSGRRGLEAAFPSLNRAELAGWLATYPDLKELVEGGAFPLKVESGDQFRMVVTKIERKSLGDDLFRPPTGYREMPMEQMFPAHPRQKPPSP